MVGKRSFTAKRLVPAGNAAGVVDVIERTAAPGDLLRHALAAREPTLVPELHGQADNFMALRAEHGRDGGRIDTA